jgi:predicted transcriptional regulator
MDAISDFARDFLVSIKPFYASKILAGQKTVELRRRFPRAQLTGATILIYASSPVQAVVGYARIKHVLQLPVPRIWKDHGTAACISKDEFDAYFAGVKIGFAIFFESVKPLKKQFKAIDLQMQFGIVPPQSYRYVTEECVALLSNERFQISSRHKCHNRTRGPTARPRVLG